MFRTTTTLRSFDIPTVKGEGSVGSVEDASLIPRKRYERDDEGHQDHINNKADFVRSDLLFVALLSTLARFA